MTSPLTPSVRSIPVGKTAIGPDEQPFVIAEVSGNHNGDLQRALAIVDAVAEAGAHAIKLQTYTADTITIDADGPPSRSPVTTSCGAGANLYQLYERGAHALGVARADLRADPRARDRPVLQPVRPHRGRAARVARRPDVQDRLARDRRPAPDPPRGREGQAGGLSAPAPRRSDEIDARSGRPARPATTQLVLLALHVVLPGPAARVPPAQAAGHGRRVGTCTSACPTTPSGIGAAVAAVALGAVAIEKHVTLARERRRGRLRLLPRAGRTRRAGARDDRRLGGAR